MNSIKSVTIMLFSKAKCKAKNIIDTPKQTTDSASPQPQPQCQLTPLQPKKKLTMKKIHLSQEPIFDLIQFEKDLSTRKCDSWIKRKIYDAKISDQKNGYVIDPLTYIDLQWVKIEAIRIQGKCSKCSKQLKFGNWINRDPDQFKIQRHRCGAPYTKDNCYLICLDCYLFN